MTEDYTVTVNMKELICTTD